MSKNNKDLNHIRSLLDRYWQGETGPEEDKTLSDFFAMSDLALPPDIAAERRLFLAMRSVPESIEVPIWLEDELRKSLEKADVGFRDSQTSVKSAGLGFKLLHRPRLYRLIEAAAFVALLLGGGTAVIMQSPQPSAGTSDSLIALSPSLETPSAELSLLSYSPSPSSFSAAESSALTVSASGSEASAHNAEAKSPAKTVKGIGRAKSLVHSPNVRIINDPKEAETVLEHVGDRLDGLFLNFQNKLENPSSVLEQRLEKIENELNKTTV